MWVCRCVCAHRCGSVHICVYVQRSKEDVGCLTLSLSTLILRSSVSLNLELGWWPASLGEPLVHVSLGAGDLNLGLQDCTASTLCSEPPPQLLFSLLKSRDSKLPDVYILRDFWLFTHCGLPSRGME